MNYKIQIKTNKKTILIQEKFVLLISTGYYFTGRGEKTADSNGSGRYLGF